MEWTQLHQTLQIQFFNGDDQWASFTHYLQEENNIGLKFIYHIHGVEFDGIVRIYADWTTLNTGSVRLDLEYQEWIMNRAQAFLSDMRNYDKNLLQYNPDKLLEF